MVTVEQLYKDFGVLADAKDKAGEHEAEFLNILSAVKGGSGEKRLASQFITRFLKHFPNLAHQAINALFDLCEDDDVMIRKQAIKDLPSLCKTTPEHVAKIAEALTQLLSQCDDAGEISLVQSSLVNLMATSPKGTLQGLFTQIMGEDDQARERAIKFLETKVKTLPEDTNEKDVEEYFVTQCKKVLQDVTKDEFISIMNILKQQKSMSTVQGRQQLVDIVTEQAELDQSFEADDPDCVDKLMHCAKQALPLFSKNVHSKAFVGYICDNVLPAFSKLVSPEEGVDAQLEMLKLLGEMSEFCGDLDKLEERINSLYSCLIIKNGSELKRLLSYINDKACARFATHISGNIRDEIKEKIRNADVISVMFDGATDCAVSEVEIVYCRICEDGELGQQPGEQLQAFMDSLTTDANGNCVFKNTVLTHYNANADYCELRAITELVAERINGRLESNTDPVKPILQACRIFDINDWPHDRVSLAPYGNTEIRQLSDHFSDVLHDMGCDRNQLQTEWTDVKGHFKNQMNGNQNQNIPKVNSLFRLQYFARGVQVYIKQLRQALQGKTGEALKSEENKIKVAALRITSNINTLIKDLFHSPPAYKAIVTVSWKPLVQKKPQTQETVQTAGQKRYTPITYDSEGAGGKKANRETRTLYAPPSGKYSEKAGQFREGQGRGGFRGRGGRRGFRGGGRRY
ncbi:hypothetical protein KUTeg_023244 [Tegillarca granosa]|uniref:Apoptosis inhibitor 5 n=1 Tax=Tegillarca granosa TaxID=220873 RepID=A0ABQ9E1G7_TEGGR|nr:hypothetical protein KUTeg_023244 [Tegillarca granosa]